MSARRIVSAVAVAGVCTLLTVPPAQAAPTAPAPTPSPGRARAVTAELDLDVSLLNKAVDVPVNIALNKVETPAQRTASPRPVTGGGSMLTATVDGVDQQGPVTLVKADVGTSVVRADARGTAASVKLVNADVHAPGLPATALLGLEAMSAEATCPVDGQPTAEVVAPVRLTVLGKPVTVGLYGPTKVDVPLVGSVSVEFSKRTTTSTTAAASALEVRVEVNPLNLNVAKVTGTVTVASVSCEKPTAPPATPTPTATAAPTTDAPVTAGPTTAPAVQPVADTTTGAAAPRSAPASTGRPAEGLATTGGGSATGPLAAGAAALVAGGAGALWATRRRRAAHARRH
ncbi:SCO1860 family LAETG-anchored protein [Kitasatospora sp. NPDC048538]|uniref:SCO1860 family LAETG-anchored protein n=1 Tax=unclassified Kitasatospora TaxID=2633591 RepID=UPI0033E3EF25